MVTSVGIYNDLGASDGKFVVVVTDDQAGPGSGDDLDIYVEVIGPDSLIVKEITVTPDDHIAQWGTGTVEIDIPTDAGSYLPGSYKFTILLLNATSQAQIGTATETYTYAPVIPGPGKTSPLALLSTNIKCSNATITLGDACDHTDYTVSSRELSLLPPLIPGGAAPTVSTSADISHIFSFAYENANYQAGLSVLREKETVETGITFTLYENLTTLKTLFVTCSSNLCEVATCYNSKFDEMELLSAQYGGWKQIPERDLASFTHAMGVTLGAVLNAGCDSEKFAYYKGKLDCGCGCTDCADLGTADTVPKPYAP